MKLVDTHAHLCFEPIYTHINEVLARAKQHGVEQVVVPAYDLNSWDGLDALHRLDNVYFAYGIHPWKAMEFVSSQVLAQKLLSGNAVAVGEIGLDFRVDNLDKSRQIAVFEMQLEVAVQLDLPVMLHCRGAFEQMRGILKRFQGKLRGVVHAFTRSPEVAQGFLDLGLYIAFGGAITRPNAKRARKSVQYVPLERILLETDCPSIGLDGVDAVHAEPMHIAKIAKELAKLRNISYELVAQQTSHNARQLFALRDIHMPEER